MANRAIQAKVLKMKKAKRLFPKSYSANVVSVGRAPNREVLNGYKERAKSLAFDEAFWDKINPARFKGVAPARKEVLEQIKRIEESCPALMCFTILQTRVHRARVFFNAEKTCFMLMYENYKEHVVRTSMEYRDKKRLIDAFHADKLLWVEFGSCHAPQDTGAKV